MKIPPREYIHMATALMWSERSKCRRNFKVGCVITDSQMKQVLSVGYNGPARGLPDDFCTGEPGNCGCLHAEDNAVNFVDSNIREKICFVTMQPCKTCAQRLVQSNVTTVMYLNPYRNAEGLNLLSQLGIDVRQLDPSRVKDTLRQTLERLWPSAM